MWRSDKKPQENQPRSYFNDISFLSPVQEEEESFDSPRSPRPRSALLPPARPYSPLPPLIIEVEKRVNKHDHPEEFYVRLEKKMKRIYRRLFIEGRNVSSPVSSADDEDDSNSNIDIDEAIHEDDGNNVDTEPVSATLDRRLKRCRATSDTDSSQSEEDGVQAKKYKSNESSTSDLLPKSSYTEFGDETVVSSIAEEGGFEIEEENIQETNAKVDSLVAEQCIDRTYNVDRDEDENTSESLDHISVTFQADVHRAYEPSGEDVHRAYEPSSKDVHRAYEPSADVLPSANVSDEMDDESGGDSANESGQDSETVDDEVQEILENNDVPGNNASTASDAIHELQTAGEESSELLGNYRVPYNLLAPAPEREVELMRTPRYRPSVGSEPEHREDGSHDEKHLDFEFLSRTQDYELDQTHEDVQAELNRTHEDDQTELNRTHEDDQTELNRTHEDVQAELNRTHEDDQTELNRTHEDDQTELNRTHEDDQTELNRTHEDDDWVEERDQGTQTCFEDINMPEGWGNIFSGQPRVYKLMPL